MGETAKPKYAMSIFVTSHDPDASAMMAGFIVNRLTMRMANVTVESDEIPVGHIDEVAFQNVLDHKNVLVKVITVDRESPIPIIAK